MYMLSHFYVHAMLCLFASSWIVACQAPLTMGFPRKHTGVGCHFLLRGISGTGI